MTPSDEVLMAYVDGELDAAACREVEAAAAADPQVSRRIEQHRALRNRLRTEFDRVLDEPVPEHLIAAVGARAEREAGNVADLSSERAAREAQRESLPRTRRWAMREWGAIAASLALGVIAGHWLLRFPDGAAAGPALIAASNGRLTARGALADALTSRLSGEPAESSAVQIGFGFRDRAGEYCRTFVLREDEALAGLACRENQQWRIDVLARGEMQSAGDYRMAGTTLPAAVLEAVDEKIEGEPLDAEGEAQARQRGWRE